MADTNHMPALNDEMGHGPAPIDLQADVQRVHDVQAVNEQLLIAGLREQALAEQLQRQLAFTSAITTSLGEGMYVLDTSGRCTFVNPAAEQILGWTLEELRERHISTVFHASGETLPAPLQEALRAGTAVRDEDALLVHRDGALFSTAFTAAPIVTGSGIAGLVMTFRDMTEVRRLQRAREEYLALLSHDLRSPLTVILVRAQALARRLLEHGLEKEATSASVIVESGQRMNAMIATMVAHQRTEAGELARTRTAVDLVTVVKQTLLQSVAPDEHRRLTLETVAALPIVVDGAQIARVIDNLLTNALKFSASGTPILIRVCQLPGEAHVIITDQGIGVAPDDLPHLFEKHYRGANAGQTAGSGLGLYGSRLIVEAHGGRIWAESAVGAGSTFTVALPIVG